MEPRRERNVQVVVFAVFGLAASAEAVAIATGGVPGLRELAAGAMLFANAVGHLAEAADHHPDLFIHNYRYLAISVMTHSEKGVTERDFALIRQIEALPHKD